MDVLLVALMPPGRRVSFLLGGAVSSSMLRGVSETECLLEDVVKDGLDDDDPFFVKRLVVLFHTIAALVSLIKFRVSTGNWALQKLFRNVDFEWIKGVNCLSYQAWEGWLCLWWFWTRKLEHTNGGRRELLACRRRAPGGAFYRAGQPA
jgi:hypothetical protein